MNCECEYFNTCSRRGAPKGCVPSFKRCRRAVKKSGDFLFPGEPKFCRMFQEEIKGRRVEGNNMTLNNSDNNSELPPEVNLLLYQPPDYVGEFLEQLYNNGGWPSYPARNGSDGTIAGYYIEVPEGTIFVPTADTAELV